MTIIKGQKLLEFSQAAYKAQTQNEIWEILKSTLAKFDVRWINYVGGTAEAPIMHSSMSTAWLEYYAEHYMTTDFLATYCAKNLNPVIMDNMNYSGQTDLQGSHSQGFHNKNKDLFNELLQMGSHGGIGIPLSKPNAEFLKASSVLFGLSDKDTKDVIKLHGEEINLIINAAHQSLSGAELQTGDDVFATSKGNRLKRSALLTTREKDILRYLTTGLRPDRIAEKWACK